MCKMKFIGSAVKKMTKCKEEKSNNSKKKVIIIAGAALLTAASAAVFIIKKAKSKAKSEKAEETLEENKFDLFESEDDTEEKIEENNTIYNAKEGIGKINEKNENIK